MKAFMVITEKELKALGVKALGCLVLFLSKFGVLEKMHNK